MARNTLKKDFKIITVYVSGKSHEKMKSFVEFGEYSSISEFVRDAIRDRLMRMGEFYNVDVSYEDRVLEEMKVDKLGNKHHPENYNIIPQEEWEEKRRRNLKGVYIE